jgi:hypothetical protein
MAWIATLTGPNAVPRWFVSPVRSAMARALAEQRIAGNGEWPVI